MAKKKEETTIIPVLPNQISLVEPETEYLPDIHIGGNTYLIDARKIMVHPDNNMFDSDQVADFELMESIRNCGQLQTATVNKRADGTMVMLAGHRRRMAILSLEQEPYIKCDIVEVNDVEELLILFHTNINRDMKSHYKIRFFKTVKQFLRQFRQGIEKPDTYENEEVKENFFVQLLHQRGIDIAQKRIWQVIELITGFTRHEQDVLTHVCDEDYRDSILNKVEDKAKRTRLLRHWQNLEAKALNGEISLVFLHNEVKSLVKLLEAKSLGKGKGKQPSLPKAPVAKTPDNNKVIQKYIQAHAGMWPGRIIELQNAEENEIMPCIVSILDEFISYQEKLKR